MERIKSFANLCPVPMVILNCTDKALFINQSFSRILGYDIKDLPDVDHWFAKAYPNDLEYRKIQQHVWKNASSHNRQNIDYASRGRIAKVTCKDGSTKILEIFGANLGEEENLGSSGK